MNAPTDRELRSARFRREREAGWQRLERLLARLEKAPPSRLAEEDLIAIPVLYRQALSSLSVARETVLDKALLDYLESLCARAYFVVYGARPSVRARLVRFFAEDWPATARALWRETAFATALLVLGAVTAFLLYRQDSDWYYAFIPGEMAGGRDPTSTTAALRLVLYDPHGRDMLGLFATFLFTHNAQIAILAFALGFAFGIPTAVLVVANGGALGAIFALYAAHGLALQLGGWLMIHGVTELFATILASAAGFRIGWSVVFPGDRARVDAVAAAGRQAATLMAGVVLMLFVAAGLEGIGRQLVTSDVARYVIAAATGAAWLGYLYAPWRRLL